MSLRPFWMKHMNMLLKTHLHLHQIAQAGQLADQKQGTWNAALELQGSLPTNTSHGVAPHSACTSAKGHQLCPYASDHLFG